MTAPTLDSGQLEGDRQPAKYGTLVRFAPQLKNAGVPVSGAFASLLSLEDLAHFLEDRWTADRGQMARMVDGELQERTPAVNFTSEVLKLSEGKLAAAEGRPAIPAARLKREAKQLRETHDKLVQPLMNQAAARLLANLEPAPLIHGVVG